MAAQPQQLSASEIAKRASAAIARVVVIVVLYVLVSAAVHYLMATLLPGYGIAVADYEVYAQLLLALLFGYLIVSGIATFFYWTTRARYDHPTAAAIRNVVRIVGVGLWLPL